jgi:hypothetical protein
MKTQSFASKRRSPVGRHVVFAGRVLAAAGMILLLILSSWLPAAPAALAQAPTADFSPAGDSPAAAGDTCVVLQPGPATMNDSYLKQDRPDERRGTDTELRVKTENNKLNRTLLQFDLSSIPSDALVSSATLSLWVKEVKDGNVSINARALTNSWNEAQVTWKARDKAANLLWTTQGGDYDAGVLDTEALTVGAKNVWAAWNVTSAAAGWVANPSGNLGVILESPVTTPKNETKFKGSDDGTASQRPKLEVCYGAGLTLTPDNQGTGVAGQEKIYAHTVTVGNLTTVVNLSAASNRGWVVTIYQDVNGNGLKDGGDTPITATPSMGPNATFKILVGVRLPSSAPSGAFDVTTVTATAVNGGASDSATNTTRVGAAVSVQPNHSTYATAGSGVFYAHTVTNNTDQNACYTISATSDPVWTVTLWQDDNMNGVHEAGEPLVPAQVCLNAGETYWLVAEVQVPGNAVVGTVNRTVIRAVDIASPGTFGTATDTTTVFVSTPPIVDGKYDDIYNISPDAEVVCYGTESTGEFFGKLATFYQPTGDAVYVVLAIDKGFVDNTYGTNAIGWPNGHTFDNLRGSDHSRFYGYNAAGTQVLNFKVDYISASSGTPSNYASLGVTGGDGGMTTGSAASIQEWGTSLAYSLNNTGYCTGGNCSAGGTNLLVNSPATNQFYTPNPTYPNWIFDVIYEIKIDKNAFTGGFGSIEIPFIHASPSKLGTNEIPVEPVPCPGEIGDYVWYDQNRDAVQDSTELGIANVELQLFRDNGDSNFDPTTDTPLGTQTTTDGGKYLFPDLPAGDYWVNVVESTVPAGYTTTTYNSPMLVNLGPGESFLDADFGYAIPASLGNCVWHDWDRDRNGPEGCTKGPIFDNNESPIPNVVVHLVKKTGPNTQEIVGMRTTDANGKYMFTGLDAGDYIVDVLDVSVFNYFGGPFLATTPEPYLYTLGQSENHLDADFGYDNEPGAVFVGDWVWYDINRNGRQDDGRLLYTSPYGDMYDTGIPCIEIRLYVGPTGATSVSQLTQIGVDNTDSWGNYAFPVMKRNVAGQGYYTAVGVGANEDPDVVSFIHYYNGLALDFTCGLAPEWIDPTYVYGATQAPDEFRIPEQSTTPPVQGTTLPNPGGFDLGLDFGFGGTPLAITLASFQAEAQAASVLVSWETVSELDNAGFNLYRSLAADGEFTPLAYLPSQAPGSTVGASYSYQDADVQAGQSYWYRLEAIDVNGAATLFDPVSVTFAGPTAVTLSSIEASPAAASSLPLAGALLALLLVPVGAAWARRRA